jgi:hypothetical protein
MKPGGFCLNPKTTKPKSKMVAVMRKQDKPLPAFSSKLTDEPQKPAPQNQALNRGMPKIVNLKICLHMPDRSKVEKICPNSMNWDTLCDYCTEHIRGHDSQYRRPQRVCLTFKQGKGETIVTQDMLQRPLHQFIDKECTRVQVQVKCQM